MLTVIIRRGAEVALTLLLLAIGSFAVVQSAPGGPAAVLLGPDYYTPEREAEINRTLGLDQPLPVRLVRWLVALASGDLGYSYFHKRAAVDVVGERVTPTFVLGGGAWLLSVLVSVGFGCWAALRRGCRLDRAISAVAVAGMSIPTFWLGILLIVVFAAWLNLLPSAGLATVGQEHSLLDKAQHLVLPLVTLAIAHGASLLLYARAAMVEVMDRDFVRTARAKGLSERVVVVRHMLRNAAIPIATVAGLNLAHLLEGSLIVETVFAWPGIGHLAVSSVTRRDYPVLMVLALLIGAIVVVANLVTDIVYRWLDPRLEYA